MSLGIGIVRNLPALAASRQLASTQSAIAKSLRRLSTGLRITSAADDAAGLAIATRLESQTRTRTQGIQNAQDGVSMVQVGDGGLVTIQQLLQRSFVLAEEAANGFKSDDDRRLIQVEFDQIREEIDRIGQTTKFDKTSLLNAPLTSTPLTPTTTTLQTVVLDLNQRCCRDGPCARDRSRPPRMAPRSISALPMRRPPARFSCGTSTPTR